MCHLLEPYKELIHAILTTGESHDDRTGTGTLRIFGHQMRFDLRRGFPLSGLRSIWWKAVMEELFWFLSGSTDVADLRAKGVTIWDAWTQPFSSSPGLGHEDTELGAIYGQQWRRWALRHDQIKALVEGIKSNPQSRRHLVTAWNPQDVETQEVYFKAPPPCHVLFQVSVSGGFFDLQLYQRSADVVIGVPYNIASYALLMHLLGHVTGLQPRWFIHTLGDAHIYANHQEAALTLLRREDPAPPTLFVKANAPRVLWEIEAKHVVLHGYKPHDPIRLPVAV